MFEELEETNYWKCQGLNSEQTNLKYKKKGFSCIKKSNALGNFFVVDYVEIGL